MEWIPIVLGLFKGTVLIIGMFYAIKWHYDQDRKAKDERGDQHSPTDMRLFATMILAFAMSLIGIVYAGCWGTAAQGGYGGALGCALTLIMGIMAARADKAMPDGVDVAQMLAAHLANAQREKIYLSVAGAVSALAWKYGDVAAAWLNGGV